MSHSGNPHAFMYRKGYYAVNEHQAKISTAAGTAAGARTINKTRSADILELYHYLTKSVEHYREKASPCKGS